MAAGDAFICLTYWWIQMVEQYGDVMCKKVNNNKTRTRTPMQCKHLKSEQMKEVPCSKYALDSPLAHSMCALKSFGVLASYLLLQNARNGAHENHHILLFTKMIRRRS